MNFLVTPAPHRYSKNSTNDMYIMVSVCLLVCLLQAFLIYRLKALIVACACLGACVLLDFIFYSIKHKKAGFDFSCLVTGLVLACIMPVNTPWVLCLVGGAVAIIFKYLFGGTGNNLFNSAALARSILGCLFTQFSFSLYSGETALQLLLSGNKHLLSLDSLFLGKTVGAIGTSLILLVVVCAVILLIFKIIRWENLLFAIIGYSAMVWIFMGGDNVLPMLLSGSFMFVTVFMLSDPTTSPSIFSARCIYALCFGVVASLMMMNNIMGETAVFLALLVVNFLAPAFDKLFSGFYKGVKIND